ncbi:MAG: ketoacyl-ACP synthase III [Bacteroidia bacterium]|nr:ketoacyl-ACP synthase III [Bacteroidia bacterium]
MRNARILASGMYVPERIINNKWFDKQLGEDVSTWLEDIARIHNRRWAAENESTADLAEAAAKDALEKAGLEAKQLDMIIVATDTPEYVSPSTASVVQHRLGASNAGTFDLNSACAGFVTALDIAATYIRGRQDYKNILVVGAYAMSKYLNKEDKKTVTLFADGAASLILQAHEGIEGFQSSLMFTQGQYHDGMGIYGGGTFKPISNEVIDNKDHLLKFVYRFPKTLNRDVWSRMARDLSAKAQIDLSEIDHFFFTQINYNTIIQTMEVLEQPKSKAHTIMHEYGYTGSACIPMAFAEKEKEGVLKRGEKIMFIGSGGGLAFSGACFTY